MADGGDAPLVGRDDANLEAGLDLADAVPICVFRGVLDSFEGRPDPVPRIGGDRPHA